MSTPLRPPLASRTCKADGCHNSPVGRNLYCESCRRERILASKRAHNQAARYKPKVVDERFAWLEKRMLRLEQELMARVDDIRRLLGERAA